ncbi:HAAS signaling domain-containing protein [Geobacillus thermodenitrificans]|uniref:DUF1700 domain-containing protein n=1 Tax=Geobacillus thermodenitrificans (strain NG80-2) TaxID=420246 RepID=A4IK36_GEOTN|nr:DUF1700 domain-containing protein [Geobacillus thermodenitrificans]ABO65690.1 Conserved hypothetical protein [Geobacillus thermodenitrificans NG80-2]MEC5189394.1 putative membrane protein [Geobacillus thermodenitrificans]MED0664390.1 DUF1700 domain-containing protein [Geobacillus thermodenitrificans]
MNKQQFLTALETELKKLPHEEREEIIQDFEEHFYIGMANGKSEEEISQSLGSPKQIAKEIAAVSRIEKIEASATVGNVLRAVWAVIGLGFFNFVTVFGPFLALLAVVFVGWFIGVAFIASPLILLVSAINHPGMFDLFSLFFSIMLCGSGWFIVRGMLYVTKVLTDLLVRYLRYNVSLVKGGLKHD